MSTLEQLCIQLGDELKKRQWKLVTAESCTGGGLSYWITSIAGSSNWFERGFVTYSNSAKEECLGISSKTINHFGAVSEQTAREMAEGALHFSKANISAAITGIAGPDGGTPDKPVGTVWIACANIQSGTDAKKFLFEGNRQIIREKSIKAALEFILESIVRFAEKK
jgi:nicotinamide-nucleotide amidase